MAKVRFLLVAFLVVLSTSVTFADDDAPDAEKIFSEGTKLTGGRILSELVDKCDMIDEEFVVGSGHEAHLNVMRCLNGKIGPVYYHHEKQKASSGASPSSSAFGTEWKGSPHVGPHVFPTQGKYVADVPKDFIKGLKKWELAARGGSAVAKGEVAAAVFTEANQGKGGYTDEKMFDYFKTAGAAGISDAIFMCAVCSYYGIGTPRNKSKAVKALKIWRKLSAKPVRKKSWADHLLSE